MAGITTTGKRNTAGVEKNPSSKAADGNQSLLCAPETAAGREVAGMGCAGGGEWPDLTISGGRVCVGCVLREQGEERRKPPLFFFKPVA